MFKKQYYFYCEFESKNYSGNINGVIECDLFTTLDYKDLKKRVIKKIKNETNIIPNKIKIVSFNRI